MVLKVMMAAVLVLVVALTQRMAYGEQQSRLPLWWEGKDFTDVRGANYVSSFAVNSIQQWDEYDSTTVDRELGFAERLKLNSVRVWLNYAVYEKDPKRFLANFEDLLSKCAKHGITAMPIIFDGCFGDFETDFASKGWMPNPGPSRILEDCRPKLKQYVDDLVKGHLGDPRILLWDVMNEPSSLGVPKIANGNAEFAWDFARYWADYIREIDRTHPATIGVGNHADIPRVLDHVDVVTFHCYQAFETTFRLDIANARKLAKDKAIMITETSTNEMASTPELNFRILKEQKIGFYFWVLIIGECTITHPGGVCDTNGLMPYPDYVAALLDFDVPREGMMPRLDRFRIREMIQNIEKDPTTAANFEERRKAMFETGRCLAWAGLGKEEGFITSTALMTEAVKMREAGDKTEANKKFDEGIRSVGQFMEKLGVFKDISAPTMAQLRTK